MSEVERLFNEGKAAVKAGDKDAARSVLLQVIELDEHHENAWLWLSAVVDGEDRIIALENVLAINPHNDRARTGLRKLGIEPPAPPDLAEEPDFDFFSETATEAQAPTPPLPSGGLAMAAYAGDLTKQAEQRDPSEKLSWRELTTADPKALRNTKEREGIDAPLDTSLLGLFDSYISVMLVSRWAFEPEMKAASVPRWLVNVGVSALLMTIWTGLIYVVAILAISRNTFLAAEINDLLVSDLGIQEL
ncbi:MAG: hypothetical protein GYB68_13545, partial [Chloroflexi bacterium]|nr:hypothetical protein [Chloroflexota bacterium]